MMHEEQIVETNDAEDENDAVDKATLNIRWKNKHFQVVKIQV